MEINFVIFLSVVYGYPDHKESLFSADVRPSAISTAAIPICFATSGVNFPVGIADSSPCMAIEAKYSRLVRPSRAISILFAGVAKAESPGNVICMMNVFF